MIVNYGFSLTGKSHVTKKIPCQDSHKIKKMENGWYIAAIADGVGSAKNSQIGSKIAVDIVVSFCEEYMPWDYNIISIKSMLRTAYNYAFKQILKESQKTGEPIESYDTTLTVVIYDGHRIVYGHSGDGAIVGLNSFGSYVPITKPQKGEDSVSVLPLRAGYTKWEIDNYEEELAAVLLMTDGIADAFFPYLLKDVENNINKAYVPLASFLADPIGFEKTEKDNEETIQHIKYFLSDDEKFDDSMFYSRIEQIYDNRVQKNVTNIIKKFKKNNFPIKLIKDVQDDKTLVGLINTEIEVDNKEISFYEEPNWEKLQEEWNRKVYPHLYLQEVKKSETDEISFTSNDEDKLNQKVENSEFKSVEDEKDSKPQTSETDEISFTSNDEDKLNQKVENPEFKSVEDEKDSKPQTSKTDEISFTLDNIGSKLEPKVENSESTESLTVSSNKSKQEMENLKSETTKSYKFPLEKTNKSNLKINLKTKSFETTKKNDNHKEEETKTTTIRKKLKKIIDYLINLIL